MVATGGTDACLMQFVLEDKATRGSYDGIENGDQYAPWWNFELTARSGLQTIFYQRHHFTQPEYCIVLQVQTENESFLKQLIMCVNFIA